MQMIQLPHASSTISSSSSSMVSHAMYIAPNDQYDTNNVEEHAEQLKFYSAIVIYNLALAHHLYYLRHSYQPALLQRAKALYPMALQVLSSTSTDNSNSTTTPARSRMPLGWYILQLACSINVVHLHQTEADNNIACETSSFVHYNKYYTITCEALNQLSDADELLFSNRQRQSTNLLQRLVHLASGMVLCQRPTTVAPAA